MIALITRVFGLIFGWLAKIIGVPVIDIITLFKTFLSWSLILTFSATVGSFIWIISNFIINVYTMIDNASRNFASGASSSDVGCVFKLLGIDTFLTSAFAAFYSSASLYAVIVISWYTYQITRGAYKLILDYWLR